jgi:hypothetical protein
VLQSKRKCPLCNTDLPDRSVTAYAKNYWAIQALEYIKSGASRSLRRDTSSSRSCGLMPTAAQQAVEVEEKVWASLATIYALDGMRIQVDTSICLDTRSGKVYSGAMRMPTLIAPAVFVVYS